MAQSSGGSPSSATARPRRVAEIAARLVDGELVLYDPRTQRLHVLNPTAGLAWRLCDGQHDQASLVAALAELYPQDREAIAHDVDRLIERLHGEGLLEA